MIERGAACALCNELAQARDDGTIVAQFACAVAFVRSHARFAWSLTVLPNDCAPSLLDASDAVWTAVGTIARDAVRAMRAAFGGRAAFNLLVYSDPHASAGSFHWHAEIVPRISTLAGFELSTGMFIRGSTAKESARRWRRMIAPLDGSI
jgi:UDPglucose--hexose-1-phosphate uridylyltransferase